MLQVFQHLQRVSIIRTWGISWYLLYRLNQHGVLGQAVDDDVLERLKEKLDWHTFIDVEKQSLLPDYPSNYYAVAYQIARYRGLLGWGNKDLDSTWFLDKITDHIRHCSGEMLYMEDSEGKGRYDRYTLMVQAERYIRFWMDQETNAVNMWDKGRKVDPYRGKERVLNEESNLS